MGRAAGLASKSVQLAAGPERIRPRHLLAAIFYIHPTTYLERDRWNAPLHADTQTELRTKLFVQSQASALTSAGQVWAPRYRQAAYGAFLLRSEDAAKRSTSPIATFVRRSINSCKEAPSDAPIILAGHSQGALHLVAAARRTRHGAQEAGWWPLMSSAGR